MAQNEYYLMHHGVKGMKWGVRRTPEQLGYKPAKSKGSIDEKYLYNASRKVYRLESRSDARSRRRGAKLEEQIEDYLSTKPDDQRLAAQDIFAKAREKEANRKLNDPEFKRKAATAAKIALVIGAAYATHKVINDPKVLAAGKDAITKVVAKSGAIKASTLKNVMNTTEFKAVKAIGDAAKSGALGNTAGVKAAKAVAGGAGKVLKKIGSEETRNVVTGIGAMAGTTAILRSQVKDFRENKPSGDKFDRAVKRTQQLSAIGENVNTLARGPKGASSSNSSSNKSSGNKALGKEVTDRIGPPSNKGIDKQSKEYQALFKGQDGDTRSTIKSLASNGYDIDQIKKYLNHSAIPVGWRFTRTVDGRYIF